MDDLSVALAGHFARSFASFEEATTTVLTTLRSRLPGTGLVVGRFDRVADVYRVIASCGADAYDLNPVTELPLAEAFCADLAGYEVTALCEAADPSVGHRIGSYVGVALELSDGEHVGALCAVSAEAGAFTEADLHLVTILGRVLSYELEHQLQREALERMAAELARNARSDGLTGLLNRSAFDAELEREWRLTNRDWTQSHLLLLDVDGFRHLVDEHGELAGDAALVDLTDALRATTRATDIIARTGPDEFAVILVRTTGGCDPAELTARLRDEVARVLEGRPYHFGFSVGHASLLESGSAVDALTSARHAVIAEKQAHAGR